MRILFADDEAQLRSTLSRGLREESYAVDVVAGGREAVERATATAYDAIILDILMPDGDGIEACRAIRRTGSDVPILILTALDELTDKIQGLDAGADDYLTKPFEFGELLARLRALLRRRAGARPLEIVVGDLVIDPASHRVWRGKREIELTGKEYAFLEYLARQAGRIVPRSELHAHVWDDSQSPFSNLIDVYASRVRKKVDEGESAPLFRTSRALGYMLTTDERPASLRNKRGRSTPKPARGRQP